MCVILDFHNFFKSNEPVVCATTEKISVAKIAKWVFIQPVYHIQKRFHNSTISPISLKRWLFKRQLANKLTQFETLFSKQPQDMEKPGCIQLRIDLSDTYHI